MVVIFYRAMGHRKRGNAKKDGDITQRDFIGYAAKTAGVVLALPNLSACDFIAVIAVIALADKLGIVVVGVSETPTL